MQALLPILNGPQLNRDQQEGSRSGGARGDPIETGLMDALSCLQGRPNFQQIVSTTNAYNRTLAHLSILYDYPSLLYRLVEWGIDLMIADVNGLTALDYVNDRESVRKLWRGGASETTKDALGRTPSELQPEGFALASELVTEVAVGLGPDVDSQESNVDEEVALREHFNALNLHAVDDSRHGQPDLDSYLSDNSTAVNSFAGSHKGHNAGGCSGYERSHIASCFHESTIGLINQILLERTKQMEHEDSGPRILPDTPYDPAVSCISKKLREAKAEPKAVDFLTSGLFPDGVVSIISLKTEMTPQEVAEFRVEDGTLKYHGLLRRDGAIAHCRLCPEDSQRDFENPEDALYHMTTDHFDMGYSCDCGW